MQHHPLYKDSLQTTLYEKQRYENGLLLMFADIGKPQGRRSLKKDPIGWLMETL
jgi:hypothetical protein